MGNKINIEELDDETRARIGLPADDKPVSRRLVVLGRVLGLMVGINRREAIWILSQSLFAVQRETEPEGGTGIMEDSIPPIGFVIYTVAKAFGLEPEDITRRSRVPEVVEARQTTMFILWNLEGFTLKEIGKALGGRSPATVSHGFQTIARKLTKSEKLKIKVETIKSSLRDGEGSDADYLLKGGQR
jgi:hypothetical protein